MDDTGDWSSPHKGNHSNHKSASTTGVTLSAIGILMGLPFWLLLIPIMTMGTANCTDTSDELICNDVLMNALAISSLVGIAAGLLITLTLGIWKARKGKRVAPTLMTAWGIAIVPMLIFMSAGWNAAG